MAILIGLDVGTSSTKGLAVDSAGRVVASASASYAVSMPRTGWSEQEPGDWWNACVKVVRELLAAGAASGAGFSSHDVVAVGLSGQMHGSVFLGRESVGPDGDGGDGSSAQALRPALLWNDQRTAKQCEEIELAVGGKRRLVELAGNAALTGFTLPKVLWLREHEPRVFERVVKVVLPKDFVRLKLTGVVATDVGDAGGMLTLDVDQRKWSGEVMRAVGVEVGLLPRIVEAAARTGAVTKWAAEATGLKEGTPVVGGAGDNQAGAVGAGVVNPGMVLATLGTSGVVYAHAEKPRRDLGGTDGVCGRLHTFCAGDGDERRAGAWCVTGCTLSAAGSLQWVRDRLFPEASFEQLVNEAEGAPAGCEGLVFMPHLTGERCPYPDPAARAGWVGLTGRHARAHLVRAVIEGVTFTMGQILDLMRASGVKVETVRLGGGGAKSAFWRQMQADVYGAPVVLTNTEEGPAFGAALMAGVGAGVWTSVAEACSATIRESESLMPGRDAGGKYARVRAAFEKVYGATRGVVGELGAV